MDVSEDNEADEDNYLFGRNKMEWVLTSTLS